MSNRLAQESSPYLRQHADNPVDWYPWGEEALGRARREDKPIFLSIGYAACHWCHVMAHESFEDEQTAALLNAHFVSIKVDREERPDLDRIYMGAVQALTGSGGWPMSVFLMPDGKPFFGGTYFPPEPRFGMSSFRDILQAVVAAWRGRRGELVTGADEITRTIQAGARLMEDTSDAATPSLESLGQAVNSLAAAYDPDHGGWGSAPKFPHPAVIDFLLRRAVLDQDQIARDMALTTLEEMARGGIYDQLGGGFHRYSVDNLWIVPHFEKMLYDNALLARCYLHAWQMTGNPLFRAVVEETLDFVLREMTDASGGFYASLDADSDGGEGSYYVWTPEQIRDLVPDQAEHLIATYGVTSEGDLEGRNILHLTGSWQDRARLETVRSLLLEQREQRAKPAIDDKVLTSWNGLMLTAFAEAASALNRPDYLQAAEQNAAFLLREMLWEGDRLWHAWHAGKVAYNGYLEDYAYVAEGLLALFQASHEARWCQAASRLMASADTFFSAPTGWYDTSDDHETLVMRPQELQDSTTPSANAVLAHVALQLGELGAETALDRIETLLASMRNAMVQYARGLGRWLVVASYLVHPRQVVAIVGPRRDAESSLLDIAQKGYHPQRLVVFARQGNTTLPVFIGKEPMNSQETAYVCQNHACLPPTNDPQELERSL